MYSGFIIDDAGSSRQEAGSLPCSRALQALRSVRGRLSGDSRREQRSNFAPYSFKAAAGKKGKGKKVRLQSCSLKMVCLSGTGDCRVPSSIRAKETLLVETEDVLLHHALDVSTHDSNVSTTASGGNVPR